jgi:hypothetical protein
METQRMQRYEITGGIHIELSDIHPFRVGEPVEGTSLVYQDSRASNALVLFTLFGPDEFIPDVDTDGLMGYAKALVTGAARDETVTIVEPPKQLVDRKTLYLGMRPRMLTWDRTNNKTHTSVRRTDYFFPVEHGLLVVSIVADARLQPNVRSAAETMMRFGRVLED